MPSNLSFLNLHLQCRLWIADLNGNINILRIYHDYLQELHTKINNPELAEKIRYVEESFPVLRKDIDELRNELHLLKMKFAGYVRENKIFDNKVYKSTSHAMVQKRFTVFRTMFVKLIKELSGLERLPE